MPRAVARLEVRKSESGRNELRLPNGTTLPVAPGVQQGLDELPDGCIVEAECLLENDRATVEKILDVVEAGARRRAAELEKEREEAALAEQRRQAAAASADRMDRISMGDFQAAFRVQLPRAFLAAWPIGGGGPRRWLRIRRSTLPGILQYAKEAQARAFSDGGAPAPTPNRPYAFLPCAEGSEPGTVVGLYVAEPRANGDFAVLQVQLATGAVEVVAGTTEEWLAS